MLKAKILQDGYYHVFVDGSAISFDEMGNDQQSNHESRTLKALGVGIVVLTNNPLKPDKLSLRLPTNNTEFVTNDHPKASDAFSVAAEALAAALIIPLLTSAPIKIYTDNSAAMATLAYGRHAEFTKDYRGQKLNLEASKILARTAADHPFILPILANRHSWVAQDPFGQYYMTLAHNASVKARGPSKGKRRLKKVISPYDFMINQCDTDDAEVGEENSAFYSGRQMPHTRFEL